MYPSPNGYDAVTAAGKEMTPLPLDFDTTQDIEALKEYLSENADQLAMLDQAADQDYLIRLSEMQTMQQTMDLSGTVRNASRLLYTDARLAELEGRTVDAADTLTKMAILGRRSSRGGLAINQLVGIAVERQALEGLMQLSSKLSDTIQAENLEFEETFSPKGASIRCGEVFDDLLDPSDVRSAKRLSGIPRGAGGALPELLRAGSGLPQASWRGRGRSA